MTKKIKGLKGIKIFNQIKTEHAFIHGV